MDIYGHCLSEMVKDAMRVIDRVFDPVAVNVAVKDAEGSLQ